MKQGLEALKHRRDPNKGKWSPRQQERKHDQWKAQKRQQKRQMREW